MFGFYFQFFIIVVVIWPFLRIFSLSRINQGHYAYKSVFIDFDFCFCSLNFRFKFYFALLYRSFSLHKSPFLSVALEWILKWDFMTMNVNLLHDFYLQYSSMWNSERKNVSSFIFVPLCSSFSGFMGILKQLFFERSPIMHLKSHKPWLFVHILSFPK